MTFSKTINRLAARPYSQGYKAPSTSNVNTGRSQLRIQTDLSELPEIIDQKNLSPLWVRLRVKLKPILIEEGNTEICYSDDHTSYHPISLYGDSEQTRKSLHQSIHLVYQGVGSFQDDDFSSEKLLIGSKLPQGKIVIPEDNILYTHSFLTQSAEKIHVKTSLQKDGKIISTPPGLVQANPLWGYGGYYHEGCDLKKIEQVYFSISRTKQKTDLQLSSYWFWQEKGANPPHNLELSKQCIVFMDPGVHSPSLAQALSEGFAKIRIYLGDDESGEQVYKEYQSFSFSQQVPGSVDVVFKIS